MTNAANADSKSGTRSTHEQRSWIARAASALFYQFVGLAVLVGFPALVTAIAPVSWVKFERREGQVSATARTCLLFVVPYKTTRIAPVIGIGDRFVEGSYTRQRRPGRDRTTKSEDEGFLVIRGEDAAAEVPVTPFNLDSVIERVDTFLEDEQARELSLFVVANWKFSVFMGGCVSLLTVLYVVALVSTLLTRMVRVVQWAAGVPPERRFRVAEPLRGSD